MASARQRRTGWLAAFLGSILVLPLPTAPAGAQDDLAPQVLPPVAVADTTAPAQDPAALSRRIAGLATDKKIGARTGTIVVDSTGGDVLYDDDGHAGLIPASTIKIATATAALRFIGPNTRLATKTTRAPGSANVYLVGGGDATLVSAPTKPDRTAPDNPPTTSLKALARDTVGTLKAQGLLGIELKVDDGLFSGPDWGPEWPEYFRTSGIAAPVQALSVDKGRIGKWGPGSPDPAKEAGAVFARLLRKQGIKVASVERGRSTREAQDLAQVRSAPVYELVGHMLAHSDNDLAESLFRLSGIAAGFGGSFAGGGKAVEKALGEVGVGTAMANFADGSGLSKQDRVSPKLLAEILTRVVRNQDGLWAIGTGLAVAGVSGTLRNRFRVPETKAAAGLIRAKTGTLNGVTALAGFVRSSSGRVLVFATLANEVENTYEAVTLIDRIATDVTTCGCSR